MPSRERVSKKLLETKEQQLNRETIESIAENLASLSDAVAALLHGPLNRRAIVLLLAHSSTLSQRQVEAVLKSLEDIKKEWLNS